MMAQEEMLPWQELKLIIDQLDDAVEKYDQEDVRKLLIKAVPEFQPQGDIVDILSSYSK